MTPLLSAMCPSDAARPRRQDALRHGPTWLRSEPHTTCAGTARHAVTGTKPANDNRPMPQIALTPAERKAHRAEAHHLDPVVMIGGDGLTPAIVKETDAALNAHGLIKIRVHGDDRAAREAIYQQLADQLNAAPIQHIGKLLVLWRPKPKKDKAVDEDRMAGPKNVKVLKYSKRGGQRPEVRVVRVLGNQRLTPGGKLKKAAPKQKSVKKSRAD
jgi:RNA-binding protein